MNQTNYVREVERTIKKLAMLSKEPEIYCYVVENNKLTDIAKVHWIIASKTNEYSFYIVMRHILNFIEKHHPDVITAKQRIVEKSSVPTNQDTAVVIRKWITAFSDLNVRLDLNLTRENALDLIRFYNIMLSKRMAHHVSKLDLKPALRVVG